MEAPAHLEQVVMQHRLVILGEEHHHPEHRAFGARILPLLNQAGITHLALETGSQEPLDLAAQNRQVTPDTDGFTFEPQRAMLLRSAIASGLSIIAFDVDGPDLSWMNAHPDMAGDYRERRMAEHIIERILDQDANARVLVWVGYAHACKISTRNPNFPKMMAQYLWELAGEEPFSIYQLTQGIQPRGVDSVIRHPEPSYRNGRPDWLRTPEKCSVQGRISPIAEYLVQLHLASEGSAGTPVDQLLTTDDGTFELLVPPGEYLLRLWASNERVIEQQPLVVQANIRNLQLSI